jgi:hypothetical protein
MNRADRSGGLQRFEYASDCGRILADVAGSCGDSAVHTYTCVVGAMPLAPQPFRSEASTAAP